MKIGFIDYSLNNYHANKFHGIVTGGGLTGDVEIVAAWESNPTGEDWCKAKNVYRAVSPSEVVAKSDGILVLAPDNPEVHLKLAKPAIDSKKPVFIDKTLAATLEDAKEIIRSASTHKTPVMSSSSLRFSVELEELIGRTAGKQIDAIFSRGFGKWRGYAVHTTSPALRLMGSRIRRVCDTGAGASRIVTLDDGSRRTFIDMRESENQMEATPWQVGVLIDKKYDVITVKKFDEFYANLMQRVIDFFASGKSPISDEEMLETVAVEVLAEQSREKDGAWMDVKI